MVQMIKNQELYFYDNQYISYQYQFIITITLYSIMMSQHNDWYFMKFMWQFNMEFHLEIGKWCNAVVFLNPNNTGIISTLIYKHFLEFHTSATMGEFLFRTSGSNPQWRH